MQLPIDAEKAPYRQKYLDETVVLAPWYVFGSSGSGVDVSSEYGDVIVRIPAESAARIIEARDRFLAEVSDILALQDPT